MSRSSRYTAGADPHVPSPIIMMPGQR